MDLNIQLSDENIKLMSKDKFRLLVTIKTKKKAIKYFNEDKSKHSESSHVRLTKLESAEYLKSKYLNKEEVQTLFKLKSRMINVKQNFNNKKGKYLLQNMFSSS